MSNFLQIKDSVSQSDSFPVLNISEISVIEYADGTDKRTTIESILIRMSNGYIVPIHVNGRDGAKLMDNILDAIGEASTSARIINKVELV